MLGCRKRGRAVLKWGGRRCDTGSGEFYIMYKGDDSVSLVTDAENSKKDFASLSVPSSLLSLWLPCLGVGEIRAVRIGSLSSLWMPRGLSGHLSIAQLRESQPALYEQTAEVEDDPRISTDHL